jgi:hypothetical protein
MGATLLTTLLYLLPATLATVPSHSGWTLTWSDDFIGTAGSLPNTNNWQIDTGTKYPGNGAAQWGTGEVETYTSSSKNVKLTGNGVLQITPLRDSSGKWTSGRIETKRKDFAAKSGKMLRIEARIKMPAVSGAGAQGYWPAFWYAF